MKNAVPVEGLHLDDNVEGEEAGGTQQVDRSPMLVELGYRCLYRVMQSAGNSFCGYVGLDSFSNASLDEDNIFYQIYKSKYVRNIFIMILILYNILRKYLLTQQ